MKYKFLTKEILQKDYDELKSYKLIANKYNLGITTIRLYCLKYNINVVKKRFELNHYIFSNDNEISFYLAGFIAADGCVYKNKNKNCLIIDLSIKDKSHLLKLKNLFSFTGPIKYKNNKCKITLYSKQLIEDLKRFNIDSRKSLTYTLPDQLKNHKLIHHFLRGYNDGDGSFFINNYKNNIKYICSIRGTNSFLNSVKDIFAFNGIHTKSVPKFNNGIDMLKYSGNGHVRKIVNYLYKDATVYLDRKYNIINKFLEI